MDGGRGSLSQQDVLPLFGMLESADQRTVHDVKALIQENFSTTKDVWLIHGLLDYYIAVQSTHALDIFISVREPHDKHMFDRMVEYLKNESTRYNCLLLLSHLVHRQPSWLFKITHHRIFQVFLNLLKTEVDPPCLMCALFSIVSLLPMIPYQIGPYLNDIFEIFSRLVAWSSKKTLNIPEVYILHLHVGVYTLFHRLYGMYPCNFLSYLRSYYGGREYKEENIRIFALSIRPMLEKVKLHPLLVTACKDSEVSQKRWKKMATHDIIALCASLSLDAIEGTPEDVQYINTGSGSMFASQASQSQESNLQYFSSMSSTVSTNTEFDASAKTCDTSWTPSRICSFSTPPPEPLLKEPQCSTSGCEMNYHITGEDQSASVDQDNCEIVGAHIEDKITMSAVDVMEAREEELVDKEVCELTSMDPVASENASSRHDTPFRSTTQNLTDQAEVTASSMESSAEGRDDLSEENHFNMGEISDDLKLRTFVHTMSRLRYFSQCGPPPEISGELPMRGMHGRSVSCPHINICEVNTPLHCTSSDAVPKEDEKLQITSESGCNNGTLWADDSQSGHSRYMFLGTPYDHLIPVTLQPNSWSRKATFSDSYLQSRYKNSGCSPMYCNFSPAELLDRHLQMGSEAHLIQLNSIPLTSTKNADWTHFGGSPPLEEVTMCRTQVQLLHNQVMFERHRREIHAERNRRFLGKVKRAQIQEENTVTLVDQVFLLKKENERMKSELDIKDSLYSQLEDMKTQKEKEFSLALEKLKQENANLQYSNKKLQGLLVSQKEENDVLRHETQCCRSQLLGMKFQAELATSELEQSRKMQSEFLWLAKENMLLREINQQYKERADINQEQCLPDFGSAIMEEAMQSELQEVKQALDHKVTLIDAIRRKVANLEDEQVSLKSKLKEQSELIEHMKDIHRNEISVCEENLAEMRKIHLHLSSHILKLYHDLGIAKLKGNTTSESSEFCGNDSSVSDPSNLPNFALNVVDIESLCCSDLSSIIHTNDNKLEHFSDESNSSSALNSVAASNGSSNLDSL